MRNFPWNEKKKANIYINKTLWRTLEVLYSELVKKGPFFVQKGSIGVKNKKYHILFQIWLIFEHLDHCETILASFTGSNLLNHPQIWYRVQKQAFWVKCLGKISCYDWVLTFKTDIWAHCVSATLNGLINFC